MRGGEGGISLTLNINVFVYRDCYPRVLAKVIVEIFELASTNVRKFQRNTTVFQTDSPFLRNSARIQCWLL